MTSTERPDYAGVNIATWNRNAGDWVMAGERLWAGEAEWGIWGVPNRGLPLLPDDMAGMDSIELGCGTGYVSGWMARRGARVVAIDPSTAQLATARRLAAEHHADVEFVEALAESVPYDDQSFDFAFSEYGAAIWSDPYLWIPEAHRLLRPGGVLVFLGTGSWNAVFTPHTADSVAGDVAVRRYFGAHRVDWVDLDDDPGIEFNLPISDWFRLFADVGFDVVDFFEVQAPESADGVRFSVPAEWAKKYPSEQAWIVRKRS